MARVDQITDKSQVPAEFHALYDRITASRGRVAGPYSILLHAPAIADKVNDLSQVLRQQSSLTPQEFVLAALAVARARDSLFVWSVQAPNARRAGIGDDAITAIGNRRTDGLNEDQADIVAYAQQIATASQVDADLFERLKARRGIPWLVGLSTTAGHFGLISGINNAFEVPPAPQGDALPVV